MKIDRIAALRNLCDHATPGPWWIDMDSREGGADQILYGAGLAICFMTSDGNWDDSEFISKVRTALPECLGFIKDLQDMVAWLARADTSVTENDGDVPCWWANSSKVRGIVGPTMQAAVLNAVRKEGGS